MQLSSVASSSGAPSSAFSINGKRVKPPSDRACGRLAPLISSVVDTRKIESWDTALEFAPIVGILRDIRRFEALFLDKKPTRHLRRSKMSSDNVDLLEDGDTIEDTDNFLCCMSVFQVPKKVDLSDAQCLQDIFIQVARECNLAVHPSTEIGTSLTALGFELDTVSKTLRHSLKFRNSFGALHRSITHTSSIREVSRFVGHCVWSIFARRIPLATIPAITKALREIHSAITIRHVAWDAPCRLDVLPLVQATQSLVDSRELSFSLPEASEGAWLEVYSDAMVDGELATWAFVSGDHVSQGEFAFKTHIFIHELLAASSALMAAAQVNPSGQTILFVDNTPAIFALRAGHSGNVWGDYILGRLFSELPATFRFKVAHVSGLFNPSDEYTRGSHGFEGQWNFTNWV